MKHKLLIAVIIIIFLAGVIGSVLVLLSPTKSHVRVLSDGKEVYAADLMQAQDTVFDVAYQGHVNTVEIQDHRIRVRAADCPDNTCVHMGWLSSASMPIVCLPHRLVIEFTDDTRSVDAVTR
ncbi:NusG domain II-containing protein [Ruminococcus sp.]|uniref:NusG domain II-containing protein n=1 Tax=Ruminococcus sp. TaxID=41978 RepID=UPI00388F82DE